MGPSLTKPPAVMGRCCESYVASCGAPLAMPLMESCDPAACWPGFETAGAGEGACAPHRFPPDRLRAAMKLQAPTAVSTDENGRLPSDEPANLKTRFEPVTITQLHPEHPISVRCEIRKRSPAENRIHVDTRRTVRLVHAMGPEPRKPSDNGAGENSQ